MKDWIINNGRYILSNWQTLLVGGAVVVGVIMFLMGCFKFYVGKKISNGMVKKTLLSFMSVSLSVPVTAAYTFLNGWNWDYYWTLCLVYAVCTILIYWFYEGTHLRELLVAIGRSTVLKIVNTAKTNPHTIEQSLVRITKEINKDASSALKKYKEDDLNKL